MIKTEGSQKNMVSKFMISIIVNQMIDLFDQPTKSYSSSFV